MSTPPNPKKRKAEASPEHDVEVIDTATFSELAPSELVSYLNDNYQIQFFIANFELAVQARLTQEHVEKVNLNSGLSGTEMRAWWDRKSPKFPPLDPDFRREIEFMSGRNPLLLRGVEKALIKYRTDPRSKRGTRGRIHLYSDSDDSDGDPSGSSGVKGKEPAVADEEEDGANEEDENARSMIWSGIYETEEWSGSKNRICEYALNSIMGKD